MCDARTGAQGGETVLVPVLATGRISWVWTGERGVTPVRARAGMYPLLREGGRVLRNQEFVKSIGKCRAGLSGEGR